MIKIKDDQSSEMMEIWKDGVQVFNGNYWDFHCGGEGLFEFLVKLGVETTLEDYKYEEDDEENII